MSIEIESKFDFSELFFSRTDKRGIILSGNSIFKRVSQFDWNELIKRPHNVIRHSDMPKGVFYLLWDRLLSNLPVGAYVKNRSKNGSYYWVFALAIPIENGFLSIRLKPSSPLFKTVQKEYQKLLKIEKSNNLSPKSSAETLNNVLLSLGFKNYDSFMIKALLDELYSRQKHLSKSPMESLVKFEQILKLSSEILKSSKEMSESFESSILLPLNLTLQSSQLDNGGNTLSVVSDKFAFLTNEIQKVFHVFEEAILFLEKEISQCQYQVCTNVLLKEMYDFFQNESDIGPNDVKVETSIFKQLSTTAEEKTLEALQKSISELDRLKTVCKQVKTSATGLEIIRLMGRIEIARLNQNQEQLNHMVDELFAFKNFLVSTLDDITLKSDEMKTVTNELTRSNVSRKIS